MLLSFYWFNWAKPGGTVRKYYREHNESLRIRPNYWFLRLEIEVVRIQNSKEM